MKKVICDIAITIGCLELDCIHREPHEIKTEVHTDTRTIPLNYDFTDKEVKEMRAPCTTYMKCYGEHMARCISMTETYYLL